MKILMTFIVISTMFYLSGCTTVMKSIRDFQLIYVRGDEIVYAGKINEQGFIQIKKEFNESLVKPTTLRISSTGSSEKYGILIGRWVYEKKLNVKVLKRCASSCANYIFPAGKTKLLGKNASVNWHGSSYFDGALQANAQRMTEKALVEFRKKGKVISVEDEVEIALSIKNKILAQAVGVREGISQFYKLIKVDPMLPNYGFYQHQLNKEDKYKYFTYSLKDLDIMGIKNIVLLEGDWSPEFDDDTFIVATKYIGSNFVY
jgi:hypothetical protein